MKVAFYLDNPQPWNSGIWYHRNKIPSEALMTRGHIVQHYAIGQEPPPQHVLEWPDTVIFGRTYPVGFNPVRDMKLFKQNGVRVLYDIDDDFWQVAKDNPSVLVSNSLKDQYEALIKECDAVTTPSPVLAKKIKKLCKGKPVFICNNAIDYEDYHLRPTMAEIDRLESLPERTHEEEAKLKQLIEDPNLPDLSIGYMAASSHWKDMSIILDALEELSKKYKFFFHLYGLCGDAFESATYNIRKIYTSRLQPEKDDYLKSAIDAIDKIKNISMIHTPFMPPEIHATILAKCDLDIGICPLIDNEFNRGKSNIKFYEYAATGTACLSSDVLPYSTEVDYRAKNTTKDWYNKLEKLITDPKFRYNLAKKQGAWVKKNRDKDVVALEWEKACQKPGGLKVLNQS